MIVHISPAVPMLTFQCKGPNLLC